MRIRTAVLVALLSFGLGACSTLDDTLALFSSPEPLPKSSSSSQARIVEPARPLQCVPYARKASGISIRGDAWTWWRSAKGRYRRGDRPAVGAVLVLQKTARLRLGHLAVVKQIIDSREILVDQANWLNRGQIHLSTSVRDVSANNDWSAVRVWYTPGRTYGTRTYRAHRTDVSGRYHSPGRRSGGRPGRALFLVRRQRRPPEL